MGLQMVSRAMSHHGRGGHPWYLCDDPTLLKDTVLDHIHTVHHQELHLNNSDSFSCSDWLGMLENLNVEILRKCKNNFVTGFRFLYMSVVLYFVHSYRVHLGCIDEALTSCGPKSVKACQTIYIT